MQPTPYAYWLGGHAGYPQSKRHGADDLFVLEGGGRKPR
jgi:hypothetical protein